MSENYKKLIQSSEFIDDEPVGFAAVNMDMLPGPIDEKFWGQISERLWSRLLSIGAAYDLHFSQAIEPIIDSVLGPEQCDSFNEELEFLSGIVNDPAFAEAIQVIRSEVSKVLNRKDMRLVISPP
ncbi:hypothetical protein [Saccharophagus degradans]|uniref:Uncharacterized protein n=1 Tax=Saccharophagus degradans TaxID=86304 RepID=A0AAW7XB55_9GAMM|nr:hypothetical protein [Saccharophagus degradans]MDO6424907.1 hypothetical protein [Saccharophagus degradans]MDO6609793.1 hypothetical protein [Saccharophagus degradans]